MATRRKPVLRPVASPTDTFVTPGIQGPALGNQSWGAIGALSQTLNQFLGAEQDRDIAYYEDAQRKAPDRALAISQLEKQGKLPGIGKVFDSDDPVDQENLKALKEAGVAGIDSPYAILMVKQARALARIQDADYDGFLRDPEWVTRFTSEIAESPEKREQLLDERRQAFLQEVGPFSQVSQQAALAELSRVETRFRQEANEAVRKRRVEDMQLRFRNAWGPMTQAMTAAMYSTDERSTAELKGALDSIQDEWKQQVTLIGADAAKANLTLSLEGYLSSNLDIMDEDDIGHVIDNARMAVGLPMDDADLQNLRFRLLGRLGSLGKNDYRKRGEDLDALKGGLERLMYDSGYSKMTPQEQQKFLYEGAGHEFIESFAQGRNYKNASELAGDLRTDILQRRPAEVDDDEVVSQLRQKIIDGDTDLFLEEVLMWQTSRKITDRTADDLIQKWQLKEQRGATGNEFKSKREDSLKRYVASLGTLEPEAAAYLDNEFRQEFNAAYESAFIASNGNEYEAIKAARDAVQKAGMWDRLKEFQAAGTWEGFASQPAYAALEKTITEARSVAISLVKEDPERLLEEQVRWENISARFTREAQDAYEKLKEDPAIKKLGSASKRNAEIASRMRSGFGAMLKRARGIVPNPQKEDIEARSSWALTRAKRISDSITEDAVRKQIRINPDDGTTNSGLRFSLVVGGLRDYAADFQSGKAIANTDPRIARGVEVSAPRAELVAAARLNGLKVFGNPRDNLGVYDDLALRMTDSDAKDTLKTLVLMRGLSPQEIISGELDGYQVKLPDFFEARGDGSWQETVPWGKIPIATGKSEWSKLVKDFEESAEESLLGQAILGMGFDPKDREFIDWYFEQQGFLMENADKNRGLIKKLREAPKDHPLDGRVPTWAKNLRDARRKGGN